MTTTANHLNELAAQCHAMSVEKGFYDDAPQVGDKGWVEFDAMKIALMHSELSEALEELRKGQNPEELYYMGHHPDTGDEYYSSMPTDDNGKLLKPEGVPAELIDTVVRIFDYAAFRGIDLGKAFQDKLSFNACRPRLHNKGF